MRAAQWLLPPGTVFYMGAVGLDENAGILKKAAETDGLTVDYMTIPDICTGTCICLLTHGHRSLVASLNAATKFDSSHLESNVMTLMKANSFYISCFLLTDSFSVPKFLSNFATSHCKTVYMNLSAPFICELFLDRLEQVLPSCSVLFGNESEARALARAASFKESNSIDGIVRELAFWLRDDHNPRLIVITQGSECTVCYDPQAGEVLKFDVPPLSPEEIVDTNGAGDAFVGGFLSQHTQGKSTSECVYAGHCVAQIVIRQSGVVFPKSMRPSF
jgi:adenosine kinase